MAFNILEYNFNYPENWQLVRLGDIAQINPETIGKNTDLKFIKYIDISSVSSHFFEKPKEIAISDAPSRAKRKLKDNDFIISTVRPNLKQYAFLNKVEHNWICSTGFCVVRANNEHLSWYLYSLVSSEIFTDYLTRIADGGAYPAFNPKEIEDAIIPLPDEDSIIKIASFTKNINEKIHLNQQTNQTLEHIAAAIFKSWFVDFDPVRAKADCLANGGTMADANLSAMGVISGKSLDELTQMQADNPQNYDELWQLAEHFPCEWVENAEFGEVPKGWESATLSAICKMQNGYAFKSSDWQDEGVPVIKIGSIQSNIIDVFGNGFVDLKFTETKKDFILRSGDIVIALTGAYVGKAGVMPANSLAMLNQRVAKFLPNIILNKTSYYAYIYCLSQQKNLKNYISFSAQGSAQPNISTKELLNYPIILANDEIHLSFEKVIQKNLDMIISNSGENEQLTKIRDELLPKLLSGELLNE